LDVVFTHVEPPGGTSGTDASPSQGRIKARGKGAPQATVLIATLKVLDGLSALIHLVGNLSEIFLWSPPLGRAGKAYQLFWRYQAQSRYQP